MKKVVYLILAHADPQQLKRLITALGDDAKFFIHLDKKAEIKAFTELKLPPNAHFLENRVNVSWAGYSMVEATLNLIKKALQEGPDCTHLVLLSGMDYPVKPVKMFREFLNQHADREFIKFHDMRESEHHMKQIERKHFKDAYYFGKYKLLKYIEKGIRMLLDKARFPNRWRQEIIPYFGSQWWALTPDCCRYILDFVEKNPWFVQMNRRTFSPDEHFFHTIVGNSPFLTKSIGVQPYTGRGTYKMANLHLIHPSLKKTYILDDLDEVLSSDKFFARKFTTKESTALMDVLDEKIRASH